jgi:hypothetical protein
MACGAMRLRAALSHHSISQESITHRFISKRLRDSALSNYYSLQPVVTSD